MTIKGTRSVGSMSEASIVVSYDRVMAEALASSLRRRGHQSLCSLPAEVQGQVAGILVLDLASEQGDGAGELATLIGDRTSRVVLIGADPRHQLGGVPVHAVVDVDNTLDSLVAAVTGVASGSVAELAPGPGPKRPGRVALTERERSLLRELLAGHDTRQVAARWSISEHTVRAHFQSLYAKLGVRSRAEAAAWALRSGLAPAPPLEGSGA